MIGEDQKEYEISFLSKEEDGFNAVSEILKKHQAADLNNGQIKKINLAYPVKKFNQAFFSFLSFSASPSVIKSVKHDLLFSPVILRSLIITASSLKTEEAKPAVPEIKKKPSYAPLLKDDGSSRSDVSRDGVLSNEALEKKLEEILG